MALQHLCYGSGAWGFVARARRNWWAWPVVLQGGHPIAGGGISPLARGLGGNVQVSVGGGVIYLSQRAAVLALYDLKAIDLLRNRPGERGLNFAVAVTVRDDGGRLGRQLPLQNRDRWRCGLNFAVAVTV